jgi:hypothetical protein
VGTVGTVDVDVRTGLVHSSDKLGEQFMVCARELAAKLSPAQPIQKVPAQYIAQYAPQAHMAQLLADE